MHTRQILFRHFSRKKRPLRENANTAKYFKAFFSKKKGPCGKMDTRQKNILRIFLFFPGKELLRITNFHIWQLNFSSGKTVIFRTQFSSHTTVEFSHTTTKFSHTTIEFSHTTIEFSYTTIKFSHTTIESSHTTVEFSHTTIKFSYTTIESSHTTIEFSHSTIESSHSTIESCWTTIESCRSRREQKYEENGRILHNLVFV